MSEFYDQYWTKSELRGDDSFKWPNIKKLLPQNENIRILDFGCGDGELINYIKNTNPKSQLYGVDVSKKIINLNRKKIKHAKFYTVDDGEKLPFPNNYFDFIVSTDVIEHVYNTDVTFKELSRVLKPKGKLLLSTPYYGLVKNILIVVINFDLIFSPSGPHIRFFTRKSLTACLKKVKLLPLKFDYFGRFYPVSNGFLVLAQKKH